MTAKDHERELVKDPAQFFTYRFYYIASYYHQLSAATCLWQFPFLYYHEDSTHWQETQPAGEPW